MRAGLKKAEMRISILSAGFDLFPTKPWGEGMPSGYKECGFQSQPENWVQIPPPYLVIWTTELTSDYISFPGGFCRLTERHASEMPGVR